MTAARNEAISYAAYRVLSARFIKAVGGAESLSEFADVMDALCYPLDVTTTEGDSPAALGNRIAAAVIAYGLTDGSNQAGGYARPDYKPVNPPLVVNEPGTTMTDPNRWQPLQIEHMISQNGIPVANGVQQAVGPHWGHVKSFALPDAGSAGRADRPRTAAAARRPGDRPGLQGPGGRGDPRQQPARSRRRGDDRHLARGARATTRSARTTATATRSTRRPASRTRRTSSTQGDFARVLAEFWADGPKSETPPGHWNVLANLVSDELGPNLRIGGTGPAVDRLEWDVKLYLALNGAVHDAAIAAWGLKGDYDGTRPISMIRYMGGLGQSSDPTGPSYDPEGLPLVPGLVEVITKRIERARAAPRGARRRTSARSRSRPGPATRKTRRPRSAASAGSWRSTGSRTSCRRS